MNDVAQQLAEIEAQLVAITSRAHVDELYRREKEAIGAQRASGFLWQAGLLSRELARLAVANHPLPPVRPTAAPVPVPASAPPAGANLIERNAAGDIVSIRGNPDYVRGQEYTAADLVAPSTNAEPLAFARHYMALISSGRSLQAGQFWGRHKEKINQALEENENQE